MSRIIKKSFINLDTDNVLIEIPEIVSPEPEEEDLFKGAEIDERVFEELQDKEISNEDVLKIAKMQADQIVEEAEQQANDIIEQAKAHAQVDRQRVLEKSRLEGYEKGYSEAAKAADELKRKAKKTHDNAIKEREKMLKEAEPEMVKLVVDVIEKIINDISVINPQIVSCLIKKGLSETRIIGDIFIHVSDADYEAVYDARDSILPTDSSTRIEIIQDSMMKRGDCQIETQFGNIDCGLSQQFKTLKESLFYILENR